MSALRGSDRHRRARLWENRKHSMECTTRSKDRQIKRAPVYLVVCMLACTIEVCILSYVQHLTELRMCFCPGAQVAATRNLARS